VRIAVLMKYVLDPDVLARDFTVDPVTGTPSSTFPSYQFDPYDRIALEVALNARVTCPAGTKVTSVCVGPDAAEDRLRETLAVKCDEGILIETRSPAISDFDRACEAAKWLADQGDVSIVLCGRLTADSDTGEVGPVVAERLGWPMISNVVAVEMRDGQLVCKRESGEGYEWVKVALPIVMTATNAPNIAIRKAKLQDVMRAQRASVTRLQASQTEGSGRKLNTVRAYIPDVTRTCRWIEGDTAEDKARELSTVLRAHLGAARAPS